MIVWKRNLLYVSRGLDVQNKEHRHYSRDWNSMANCGKGLNYLRILNKLLHTRKMQCYELNDRSRGH